MLLGSALSLYAAPVTHRNMKVRDIPELLEIDKTLGLEPLSEAEWEEWINKSHVEVQSFVSDHKVVGYIIKDYTKYDIAIQRVGFAPDFKTELPAKLKQITGEVKKEGEVKNILVEMPLGLLQEERADFFNAGFQIVDEENGKLLLEYSHTPIPVADLDHYQRLQVSRKASAMEVKKSLDRILKSDKLSKKDKELIEQAGKTILDVERRRAYDGKVKVPSLENTEDSFIEEKEIPTKPKTSTVNANVKSKDFYDQLGVERNANQEKIISTYKKRHAGLEKRIKESPTKQNREALANLDNIYSVLAREDARNDYDEIIQSVKKGKYQKQRIAELLKEYANNLPTFKDLYEFDPEATSIHKIFRVRKDASSKEFKKTLDFLRKKHPKQLNEHPEVLSAYKISYHPALVWYFDKHAETISSEERKELLQKMALLPDAYVKYAKEEGYRPDKKVESIPEVKITKPTFYQILGLKPDATQEQIQRGIRAAEYRAKQARKVLFPDEIRAIYVLSDENRRKNYDQLREEAELAGFDAEIAVVSLNQLFDRLPRYENGAEVIEGSLLKDFLDDTSIYLTHISHAPSLAKRFLKVFASLVENDLANTGVNLTSFIKAVEVLAFVDRAFRSKEDWPVLFELKEELKRKLVEGVLPQVQHDPVVVNKTLEAYLEHFSPDLNSKLLRDARNSAVFGLSELIPPPTSKKLDGVQSTEPNKSCAYEVLNPNQSEKKLEPSPDSL